MLLNSDRRYNVHPRHRRDRALPLVVPREKHDRQPDRQERDRAEEYPVGQPQLDHDEVHHPEQHHRRGPKHRCDAHRMCLPRHRPIINCRDWRRTGRRDSTGGRQHRIEVRQQLLGLLPPIRRLLLQTAHHQHVQRVRHRRPILGDRLRHIGHMGREHRLRVGSTERGACRQHLVRHRPHRIDIRPMIHMRIRHRLLRGHVGGRAQRHAQ